MSGPEPEVSVLLPYYRDSGDRERFLEHNSRLWRQVHGGRAELVVGRDPMAGAGRQPFSPASARNDAFERSTADWLLAYDADALPPTPAQLDDMLDRARGPRGYGWSAAYSGCVFITVEGTRALLDGADIRDVHVDGRTETAMGPTVISRDLFRLAGGYDGRFRGWGFEDLALRRLLHFLAGPSLVPPHRSDVWAMQPAGAETWRRDPADSPNRLLYETYYQPLASKEDATGLLEMRGTFLSSAH